MMTSFAVVRVVAALPAVVWSKVVADELLLLAVELELELLG